MRGSLPCHSNADRRRGDRGVRVLPRRMVMVMIGLCLMLGACAGPVNPSLPLDITEARAALREMRASPGRLERPVVILSGFGDPGLGAATLHQAIGDRVDDERTLTVSFSIWGNAPGCRRRVIRAVSERFGADEDGTTVEVDVVAHSMGGLMAVHATDPGAGPGRLRIRRLFTISTPFQGASMAEAFPVNTLIRDMRGGSAFLRSVASRIESAEFELVTYARLGDIVVPPHRAAPAGRVPYWVSALAFQPSHAMAHADPRIRADLIRRLRGESSYAIGPPARLPE